MSEQHARAIDKILREYQATVEAARIVRAAFDALTPATDRESLDRVVQNAERTYYVRLCADIEGMLHRHLGDHFRFDGLADEQRATAGELLEATRHRLRPGSNRELPAAKLNEARRAFAYRNRLSHGNRSRQAPVPLAEAVTIFETLVLELPNMVE